jgi:hypothetical protein
VATLILNRPEARGEELRAVKDNNLAREATVEAIMI